MKSIVTPILILLVMSQTFSHWFMIVSFKLNQAYIAKNLCENRYRPKLNCNGNCVLMKKLKQEEKQEKNTPASIKTEANSIVLSSKSFFATVETPVFNSNRSYIVAGNSGKPVDRADAIFHPPSV